MGGEPDVIFRHSDPDLDTLEQRLDSSKSILSLSFIGQRSLRGRILARRVGSCQQRGPVPHRRTKAYLEKSLSQLSTVFGIAEDGCNFSCAAL